MATIWIFLMLSGSAVSGSSPSSASYDAVADHDGSGIVNAIDVTLFMKIHGKPPGPSGLACAGSPPCPAS